MHIFYGYVYPVCLAIYVIFSFMLAIMNPTIIFSLDAVTKIVWKFFRGLFTLKPRRHLREIGEVIDDTPGRYWGLIPGIACFISWFFLFGSLNYERSYGPSIDGTYAKVVKIKHHHYAKISTETDVYDVEIDLGYGTKKEAILERRGDEDDVKVGEIVGVASRDGLTYYDHLDSLVIRPMVAWL